MSKRKDVPKSGAVWHLSSEEATLAGKPRYNGFACGHGAHGDAKYNRAKENRAWRAQLKHEGASRDPFPLQDARRIGAGDRPFPAFIKRASSARLPSQSFVENR